jgi:hypothetical protein
MRKGHVYIILMAIMIGTIWSCIEEDFFGLSPFGRIKAIEVSNQASPAIINNDSNLVIISFPRGIDLREIQVRSLTLSSFATADLAVGDVIDFNSDKIVNVTAEDGTISMWRIAAEIAGENPQLPNSDFNSWYEASGGYLEPGESAESTIWGTSNGGTQIIGIFPVTAIERSADDLAPNIETLYSGDLAAAFGAPISAGSVYTGVFNTDNISITDPEAAIDFGTIFSARPTAFRLTYQYTPGPENLDRGRNPLAYSDACDIYLLLELRGGSSSQRLATGWFRSDETVSNPETIEVPITYGPLDNSFPDYMFPDEGDFVSADSAAFILPTHLTFVATSSFDGANFAGAIGSTLVIDDLELVY